MKSINEIISVLKEYLEVNRKKYNLKSLGIFGSYTRGDQTPDSDVDIVVEFEQPIGLKFVTLANELEVVLQMKVDLVSRRGVKPKYWAYIKEEVIYV